MQRSFSYLGYAAGVRDGINGADLRLKAAQVLERKLELIAQSEPPYDIFARCRRLSEQPIGWNPDLHNGVRLKICPFVIAGVLSQNKKPKFNINWDKDRDKEVESAPWFRVFNGDRINDHSLPVAERQTVRAAASGD